MHLISILDFKCSVENMHPQAVRIVTTQRILNFGENSANFAESSISSCQNKAPPFGPPESSIFIGFHGWGRFLRNDQNVISQKSDLPGRVQILAPPGRVHF